MEVMSRRQASVLGLKTYFNGERCARGHTSRYVSDNSCIKCRKKLGAEWVRKNREKQRERVSRWRSKNPDRNRELGRASRARSYKKDRQRELDRQRAAYKKNRGKIRKRQKLYYQKTAAAQCRKVRQWRILNPERYSRNTIRQQAASKQKRMFAKALRELIGEGPKKSGSSNGWYLKNKARLDTKRKILAKLQYAQNPEKFRAAGRKYIARIKSILTAAEQLLKQGEMK